MAQRTKKRWVARVKTESTFPPEGLFKKNAATIASTLASRRVSPKGPGSGMRMLTYFINRDMVLRLGDAKNWKKPKSCCTSEWSAKGKPGSPKAA